MNHVVLLVDDDPNVLRGLTRLLHKEPYEIRTAGSAEEAAELLTNERVDLIVSDEEMPGMSGTEFLSRAARDYPEIVGIILTGHPTLPAALRAINEGKVYQFFTKPCNEIDLAITIRHALEQKDLSAKSRELLEVTKQQSALLEEAKLRRRLADCPNEDKRPPVANEGQPATQREFLEAIDDEIRRGKEVLKDVQSDIQGADHQGKSVAAGALRED